MRQYVLAAVASLAVVARGPSADDAPAPAACPLPPVDPGGRVARRMEQAEYLLPISAPVTDATPGALGRLSLVALSAAPDVPDAGHPGMRLLVVNKADRPAGVMGQDGRVVDLWLEAVDPFGQWGPIQVPWGEGGCGFGMGIRQLRAGRAWDIAAPRYAGSFPTRLRFALVVWEGPRPGLVVSNEFGGWVNPEQFAPPPPPE